jgi:hypothetical protein
MAINADADYTVKIQKRKNMRKINRNDVVKIMIVGFLVGLQIWHWDLMEVSSLPT